MLLYSREDRPDVGSVGVDVRGDAVVERRLYGLGDCCSLVEEVIQRFELGTW